MTWVVVWLVFEYLMRYWTVSPGLVAAVSTQLVSPVLRTVFAMSKLAAGAANCGLTLKVTVPAYLKQPGTLPSSLSYPSSAPVLVKTDDQIDFGKVKLVPELY